MLGRRTFLALASAALWPGDARAQQGRALPRIGWISTSREPDPFLDGFREGLRKHGYEDGRNIVLELRYGTVETLRAAVAELKPRVAFIVAAGPAMSYGANVREAYVHLGRYADRLLRGDKPADLPIVQPTRFELVVNVKTARLLDLAIPPAVAMRAARLIE
jgi:hypothetical protein